MKKAVKNIHIFFLFCDVGYTAITDQTMNFTKISYTYFEKYGNTEIISVITKIENIFYNSGGNRTLP